MPIEQNLPKYFKSFNDELNVVKDRVRSIIGNRHWASDGSHKEVILQDVIRRFLPSKFEITSGFIISDDGNTVSKQLDIIIYENCSPVFFKSANFVIIPKNYVKAVIEVKTNINNGDQFKNSLENLLEVQKILLKGSDEIYTGLFSYDYTSIEEKDGNIIAEEIFTKISGFYNEVVQDVNNVEFLKKFALTSLCINGHIYGLHWNGPEQENPRFGIYETKENSFNFFISNLLNTLDNKNSGRLWYPSSKQAQNKKLERLI